jgi:hypothetical protein
MLTCVKLSNVATSHRTLSMPFCSFGQMLGTKDHLTLENECRCQLFCYVILLGYAAYTGNLNFQSLIYLFIF